jgi:hypothetical protein
MSAPSAYLIYVMRSDGTPSMKVISSASIRDLSKVKISRVAPALSGFGLAHSHFNAKVRIEQYLVVRGFRSLFGKTVL